jgi:hypothetical protein
MDLQGLETSPAGAMITALFSRVGRRSTRVRVARLGRRWVTPVGPALKLEGQVLATLGEHAADVRSAGVDVGLEELRDGRRWVATLRPSGWSRTDAIAAGSSGPQLGGPVRLRGGTLLAALTEAEGGWPMTVHAWSAGAWSEVGDGPQNVGSGQAQGSLNAVGDRAWATWVQTGPAAGGMFPTSYYAAPIELGRGAVGHPVLLWHGRSIGPGPVQAVAYRGHPVFLYTRQRGRKGGLHASVAFVRPRPRADTRKQPALSARARDGASRCRVRAARSSRPRPSGRGSRG